MFSLIRTNIEPIKLEVNKEVTPNMTIKKYNKPSYLNQFNMKFQNYLGQYYEFTQPIKISFGVQYESN